MKKRTDYAGKPYNRCLSCEYRGGMCDGPRTAGMTLERWCEFMRDMKEVNGLTNAEVADRAGISVKTVERLMAQNCDQDIMRETARLIENAIVGSANKYPCYMAYMETQPSDTQKLNETLRDLERALDDNRDYRTALDNIHASYNAEMQTIRGEAKSREESFLRQIERLRGEIDYLRLENDRKAKIIDKFLES